MKSSIVKRSILIGGHKTSVSLEDPFWSDRKQIARTQHVALSALITHIDGAREQSNLPSAIRVFVLRHSAHLFAMGSVTTRLRALRRAAATSQKG